MISILILIGKIIGITILCLIGLLLFVILLVLFVPIRYSAVASKEKQITAKAKVCWLLNIVSVTLLYDKDANILIKVFGIPIYNAKRKEEKEARKAKKEPKESKKKKENKDAGANQNEVPQIQKEQEITPEEVKGKVQPEQIGSERKTQPENQEPQNEEPQNEEPQGQEPKQVFMMKIKQFLQAFFKKCTNIKYTISKICDRIKKVIADIAYYVAILQSEQFKEAYELCKKQLIGLWKHIKPRKYQIYLHIGTEDPSTLGSIMAYYGMLYPLHGGHIVIRPDFEQVILEGNAFLKGRITVFMLIRAAWIIYFNKNIRRILALLKKEES